MLEKNLARLGELVGVLNRAIEVGATDAPSAKFAKSELDGLNKLLKEGFTIQQVDEVSNLEPVEIFRYFLDKEGKFLYTCGEQDRKTGRYVINEKKNATIYFPAVERAYWDKHKTSLTSEVKYLTLADVIRWKLQSWKAEDSENGNIFVPPMTAAGRTMYEQLCAENDKWELLTSNGIAFIMDEFRKALLPEGVEPPAYYRNADRHHLAIALLATQSNNDGVKEFKEYRTVSGQNEFFKQYFGYLRMAYLKKDYEVEKK